MRGERGREGKRQGGEENPLEKLELVQTLWSPDRRGPPVLSSGNTP